MRITIVVSAALAVMAPTIGAAQSTGNEMLPLCSFVVEGGTSAEVGAYFDAGRCVGAMQALRRLGPMLVDGAFCIPNEVTTKQMARTAVVGLKRRPEALHQDFTYLAAFVFSDIWPCTPARQAK